MYKESLPTTTEFPELEAERRSEGPSDLPVQTDEDWIRICQDLGYVAIRGTAVEINSAIRHHLYLRGNSRLSADDIRELERYLDFLRHHYGIAEGATVFPKRAPAPPPPTDEEGDDAP